MKILIRGAGDLATGIAARLYHSGHNILMTEREAPLTVRRTVAFSRAVYEGSAKVEDMEARLVHSLDEAYAVMGDGNIALIVDEAAEIRKEFCPDVVVDAILAKKNLGTKITDAPLVVGVGPGFYAGQDCHCVVETKRGHTLGQVIYDGAALPNTGVPGEVGGYTTERLLKASDDGVMEPLISIGDMVEKGQIAAYTGGEAVYAAMSGMVRGMLQKGVSVVKGMKIGDIDARCEKEHCWTISDKARAIGGGVLEAVQCYETAKGRFAIVMLAAGTGSRYGKDKLSEVLAGKPLYQHSMERLEAFCGRERFVVTGNAVILEEAKKRGISGIVNREPHLGISHSLQLGLQAVLREKPEVEGVLFGVCDQPGLKVSTIQKIWNTAAVRPGKIICAGKDGQPGNPVLWPKKYFRELLELKGDTGGRAVMRKYPEQVYVVEADERELKDIDRKEDMGSF